MTILTVVIASMAVLCAFYIAKGLRMDNERRFFSHRLKEGVDLYRSKGRWVVDWSTDVRLSFGPDRVDFGQDYAAALSEYESRKRTIEARERGDNATEAES